MSYWLLTRRAFHSTSHWRSMWWPTGREAYTQTSGKLRTKPEIITDSARTFTQAIDLQKSVKENGKFQFTVSEMATPTKLSRITGQSWSMISIIGLSSSCKPENQSLCTQTFNDSLSCSPTWFLFYLRRFNGHEKASYLFENGNGESAGGQLTGAEQNKRQALHSMQHSGVGTTFSRYLETGAALQRLGRKQHETICENI